LNYSGIHGHAAQRARLDILAGQRRIPQTMLFTGTGGTGKRLVAERFLSALFCSSESKPCLDCEHCRQISKEIHPDFITIRPNEKGTIPIGSDEKKEPGSVRWLIERLSRKTISGATAVIIDGIDRVTEEGQNALLKTIEEPSLSTFIVMIAEGKSRILPTIVSRSIEIPFTPLSDDEVLLVLNEHGESVSEPALAAFLAGGSAGRAMMLAGASFREKLFKLCGEISTALNMNEMPLLPADLPGKVLPADRLIDIMINVYGGLLHAEITGREMPPGLPAEMCMQDQDRARVLIKILLALKQGQSHNLNFRIALKGLLYSLYLGGEMQDFGPLSFDI
jgi:hypothetical protein